MNRKLGLYSSIIVCASVILFAIGMIIDNLTIAYASSMLISWSYILLVCCFAVQASSDRKAAAYAGLIFAGIYGVFVNVVYFTQLTTVANQTASAEALEILSFQSLGSLMFNFDLFGYGMMAISTFFVGLAFMSKNKYDKALKLLLMIHGIFVVSCILMPMFNIFNSDMGESGDIIGTIALLVWCIYFLPVGILSYIHFKNNIN